MKKPALPTLLAAIEKNFTTPKQIAQLTAALNEVAEIMCDMSNGASGKASKALMAMEYASGKHGYDCLNDMVRDNIELMLISKGYGDQFYNLLGATNELLNDNGFNENFSEE